jgi:hypothetical protein
MIELIRNNAGGIDLITERDSGNPVRILTGSPQYSLAYWESLRDMADTAISELEVELF